MNFIVVLLPKMKIMVVPYLMILYDLKIILFAREVTNV